jgi:hypothetical protein
MQPIGPVLVARGARSRPWPGASPTRIDGDCSKLEQLVRDKDWTSRPIRNMAADPSETSEPATLLLRTMLVGAWTIERAHDPCSRLATVVLVGIALASAAVPSHDEAIDGPQTAANTLACTVMASCSISCRGHHHSVGLPTRFLCRHQDYVGNVGTERTRRSLSE